jgi:hypothetical protein
MAACLLGVEQLMHLLPTQRLQCEQHVEPPRKKDQVVNQLGAVLKVVQMPWLERAAQCITAVFYERSWMT